MESEWRINVSYYGLDGPTWHAFGFSMRPRLAAQLSAFGFIMLLTDTLYAPGIHVAMVFPVGGQFPSGAVQWHDLIAGSHFPYGHAVDPD